jgi:hypothetical protein
MERLGFPPEVVARLRKHLNEGQPQLEALGRRLGWPEKNNGVLIPPSLPFSFLAKMVGRADEYDYLYQATSRYVHFSPQQLLRRGWGKKGRITIDSAHMSEHWASFALYWCFSIFFQTLLASRIECGLSEFDAQQSAELSIVLSRMPKSAFLTADELRVWPDKG